MKKLVDGQLVDLTEDELSQREAEQSASVLKAINNYISSYCDALEAAGTVYTKDGVDYAVETTDRSLLLIGGCVTRALLDNDLSQEYEYFPPKAAPVMMTNADFIRIGLIQSRYLQKLKNIRSAAQKHQEQTGFESIADIETFIQDRINA